jgi:phenylalanyl-tRNA synthetase beta chain
MKFTLSWLKDHLDTTATLDEVVETLTRIGLEVENVEDPGAKLKDFTIAYVIEAKQHPNADRLRVCMVDTGAGTPVQVVCGAPNARTGMKGVFSPPGTYIPGKDITLGKGVIRGVESNGMLCSGKELEISEDHDGILDLPEDAPVGQPYATWAGLDDPVIEINLTPNRPDATSVYGIARDLAAAGLGKLKDGTVAPVKGEGVCPVSVSLALGPWEKNLCPLFVLRQVSGVKNGPSPEWMQKRLRGIGLRPINALVDITNYITFDRGRPLHVFDAAKVKGNLTVRRAAEGEEMLALDGKTYALDDTTVVIADETRIESLAGVMGGEHSGCDETTTDVLIESALWDPLRVAQTGRKLGIITDARYRFERGVDPAFTLSGAELATRMVIDLCGGTATDLHVAGMVPDTDRVIDLPWSEVKRLTGLVLPVPEMRVILSSLGFWVSGTGDIVKVSPPSWRPDIEGKADLVEEITRIAGLDRVENTPFPRSETVKSPVLTLLQRRTRQSKRLLAARGLVEAITWSFISREQAQLFGGGQPEIALANPIAADLSDMRPSLLPGMIAASQRNADRGYDDVALFEVGQVFGGDKPEDQKMAAAIVRRGAARSQGSGRHWADQAGSVSVFDIKADAMALLSGLGVALGGLQVVPGGPSWCHPGRSATLQFGPQNVIGWFGEMHPGTLEALDAAGPIVACEIILDAIPAPKAKPTKVKPKLELAELHPVRRDYAFVVDNAVPAETVMKIARGIDRNLFAGIAVFDIYTGTGIAPGQKSIAIEITLQPKDKTLTDVEIEAFSQKLVAEVTKKTGATLRG